MTATASGKQEPVKHWFASHGNVYRSTDGECIALAIDHEEANDFVRAANAIIDERNELSAALTAANARVEALERENFDLTCQRNAAWSELEERGDCN